MQPQEEELRSEKKDRLLERKLARLERSTVRLVNSMNRHNRLGAVKSNEQIEKQVDELNSTYTGQPGNNLQRDSLMLFRLA